MQIDARATLPEPAPPVAIVERVRSSKPASGTWRTIALPGLDGSDTEAAWTTALAAHLGGEAEQEIDGVVAGRVDVLTDTQAIELDWLKGNKFHEGIGQALHYGDVTGQQPVLALISAYYNIFGAEQQKLEYVSGLCAVHGVEVWELTTTEGMMKTSKLETVRNIGRIRTPLVTLSVAVCLATLMGCGNTPEKDTSPAADTSPEEDASPAAETSPAADASPADAIGTVQKAAEQGDAEAQYNFGVMYYNGQSVRKNDAEAVKWFRKAAEQGHAEAQTYLAYLYINDFSGVAKDTAEAMKWYRKAAEQGHAEAQFNLAVTYDNGEEGVPEDDAEAVKWYRKAAEQGHAPATKFLGQMYKYGWGVPKDDVAAYAWYSVGAALRAHYRKDRDSFKRSLTPAQVEKGEAMATEISERIEKRKAAKGQ